MGHASTLQGFALFLALNLHVSALSVSTRDSSVISELASSDVAKSEEGVAAKLQAALPSQTSNHLLQTDIAVARQLASTQAASNAKSASSSAKDIKAPSVYASLSTLPPPAKVGMAATVLCLLYTIVDVACLAQISPGKSGASTDLWLAAIYKTLDTIFAACVLAIDSALTQVIVPLLPQLHFGHAHGAPLLFFTRPLVGLAVLLLLPLLLRAGVHRGRILIAVGLIALSVSCLTFAVAACFTAAMVARALSAIASAMIIAPTIHNVLLQAPVEQAGWRIDSAVFGMAVGSIFGPWVGSGLNRLCGPQTMMVIMAFVAAGAACVHLAASRGISQCHVFSHTEAAHFSALDRQGTVFQAALDLVGDAKRGVALMGIGVVSASLALHSTLLPFCLGHYKTFPEASDLVVVEEVASLVFGIAIISCGFVADLLGEQWAARGMVIAIVMNVLSLRCIAENAIEPWIVSACIVLSHIGLGMYTGLALPVLSRLTRGDGSCPTLPAAAVASAAFGALLFFGDALGVGLQLMLYPLAGFKATVLVFAIAAAGQAIAVLLCPGWIQKANARGSADNVWKGHIFEREKSTA